jgi:hypothetical protein
MAKKRYKGFKNKKSFKKGKLKITNQLGRFLDDNKLSGKELRKINKQAKNSGFEGSPKRLAKLIKKTAKKVKPKAVKKGNVQNIGVRKNTPRLKQIKKSVAATPAPTDLDAIRGRPPEVQEAPDTQRFATPEPAAPPPPGYLDSPEPTVGTKVKVDTPPSPTPELEGIDYQALLDELVAQRNQPQQAAPTINVQMPEPEDALGRAKSTSSYLSGGSAGGIRRRRSNRSKLGLSGLGTNQLNRNVSNLLSIRGISI